MAEKPKPISFLISMRMEFSGTTINLINIRCGNSCASRAGRKTIALTENTQFTQLDALHGPSWTAEPLRSRGPQSAFVADWRETLPSALKLHIRGNSKSEIQNRLFITRIGDPFSNLLTSFWNSC